MTKEEKNAYYRKWRKEHKEIVQASLKKYYDSQKGKENSKRKQARAKKRYHTDPEYKAHKMAQNQLYRDRHPEQFRDMWNRAKNAAYALLGEVCIVCGFADRRALQIDHKKGNGNRERKRLGQLGIYRRVLRHPEDYQILCANHNRIKMFENHEVNWKVY